MKAYDESGNPAQEAVKEFDVFVRAVGIGPQVRVMI